MMVVVILLLLIQTSLLLNHFLTSASYWVLLLLCDLTITLLILRLFINFRVNEFPSTSIILINLVKR
jgi:hypothetical protein